jgi:ATP-dependent helicase HrpA
MNFRVVDADGKLIEQGRDLPGLLESLRAQTRAELQTERDDSPAQKGLTRWTMADVPQSWRQRQAGVEVESYPALVDEGDSVALMLLDYPGQAELAHRRGLIKLLRLQCAEQVRYLRKQMLRGNEASLVLAATGLERAPLVEDLVDASFSRALLSGAELPRSKLAFDAALKQGRGQLVTCANEYESVLLNTLTPLAQVRRRLADVAATSQYLRDDIETQLAALFRGSFLRDTDFEWVRQYPRYCRGILERLQRLSGQQQKDRAHCETLREHAQPLLALVERDPAALQLNPQTDHYRWMLEEFRVSLYAQSLGTSLPVSAKRLQEQWHKVLDWDRENPR